MKIELRETSTRIKNPSYDSRTKDQSKHGLRTIEWFEAKTRFVYTPYPRGGGKVSVLTALSELDSNIDAVIAALIDNSVPTEPTDYREAVLLHSHYGYAGYGEDIVNRLLQQGKLTMTDLLDSVESVFGSA